jgi:hypothetical protein
MESTSEKWAQMRDEWENDPRVSYRGLESKYGIAKSSISDRARREGWRKKDVLNGISQSAQLTADSCSDISSDIKTDDSIDNAEKLRAKVLAKHRMDLVEARIRRRAALHRVKSIQDAKEGMDKDELRLARTEAEMLKLHYDAIKVEHELERKAWGLDNAVESHIVISNPRTFDV